MTPDVFVAQLRKIAADARYHPEPAIAVALLAQLLLDLTLEIQPLAEKYGLLLKASGFLASLEAAANQTAADMQASAAAVTDNTPQIPA